MRRALQSKKIWVSIIGAVVALILAILAWAGVNIPPDVRTGILNLIAAIVASYNVGQGVADGLSRGRTSGYALAAGTVRKLTT
jgi:uncharacterized membrane protein